MPDYCLHCCLEHSRCTCDAATKAQPVDNYSFCLPAGTLLGAKYLVGPVLGAGGFGITYLAVDEKLGLRVAIKEYMPRNDAVRGRDGYSVGPATREDAAAFEFGLSKFIEEARLLARISEKDNPHIVSIHNFFEANGTAYLVMRYLEGQTLGELLKSRGGSLAEQDAIFILSEMLDGLRQVHAEGLIHRDIKPGNVFITSDGSVKLIDFGAARYAQSAKSRGLTQVLTAPYAPLEQYSKQGNQGPWTDLYAAGVTFYQMLTGRLPAEALDRVNGVPLVLPHEASGGATSQFLDTLVSKAINTEASKRYQTAVEFRQALFSQPLGEPIIDDLLDDEDDEDVGDYDVVDDGCDIYEADDQDASGGKLIDEDDESGDGVVGADDIMVSRRCDSYLSNSNPSQQRLPQQGDRGQNGNGLEVDWGTITPGHVLGLSHDNSLAIFDSGKGTKYAIPTSSSSASASVPTPSPSFVPEVRVNLVFSNESEKKPPVAAPQQSLYWGEVYERTAGGSYRVVHFKTSDRQKIQRLDEGQIAAYEESCLLKPLDLEEDRKKWVALFKRRALFVLLLAGLITLVVLWFCGVGCSGSANSNDALSQKEKTFSSCSVKGFEQNMVGRHCVCYRKERCQLWC